MRGGSGASDDDLESARLDRYLDAPEAGIPAGLDPALVAVVDHLRRVAPDDWERLGPDRAARRPLRRDVIVAAAAVAVALGLLVGLTGGGSPGPTRGAATGAPWRVTSLFEQSSWRVGASSLPSVTIACPTHQQCYASDAASGVIEISTDGGQSFRPTSLPQTSTITTGLSCPTPLDCLAGGLAPPSALTGIPAIPNSALGGGTATAGTSEGSPPPQSGVGDQANPVDGTDTPILLGTVDGGGSWSLTALPSQVTQVVDVVCTSPTSCLAAVDLAAGGAAVLSSTDGGATWSSGGPLPDGFVPAVHQGLACGQQTCLLVGSDQSTPPNPMALSSTDGGATWSSGVTLPGLAVVDGVQCPTASTCVAIGQGPAPAGSAQTYGPGVVVVSADSGANWTVADANGLPSANLYTLSCVGRLHCWIGGSLTDAPLATGYALVATTTDGGADFTVASLPGTDESGNSLDFDAVLSLSCPRGSCVALAALSSQAAGSQAVLTGY